MRNGLRIFALSALGLASIRTGASEILSIALKGGTNLSSSQVNNASGSKVTGYQYGNGFAGGLGFDIGVGPLGVLMDFLYTERRVTWLGSYQSLRSMHIPLLLRLQTGMLSLQFGGFFAQAIGDVNNNGVTQSYYAAGLRRTDYGLTTGLALSLPAALAKFVLEVRYNHGLANRVDNPIDIAKINSRSFDFLGGFYF